MKCVFFNGSLKSNKEDSTTYKVVEIVRKKLEEENIQTKHVYLLDHNFSFGTSFKIEGEDEEKRKELFKEIYTADIIFMCTPIWWGNHSSLTQKLMERMTFFDDYFIETGKNLLENKICAVLITGTSDGFQNIYGSICNWANHLGMTVPPKSFIIYQSNNGSEILEKTTNECLKNILKEISK